MAIVARAGSLIILGLEEGNVQRLKDGKPFHQDLGDILGLPYQLVIYYGATMDDLMRTARELSGPDTVVTDHRNRKKN